MDRAALDAALAAGLPIGGWVPRGRLAEDGVVPDRYPGLREADTDDYAERTRLNVRDTDATLVLHWGPPAGGTLETIAVAAQLQRPTLLIDLADTATTEGVPVILRWLDRLSPSAGPLRLNVAGPRASLHPGVTPAARAMLDALLDAILRRGPQ